MNDTPEAQDAGSALTRRRLLGSAATVGALAAVDMALPSNIRKAVAAGATHGGKLSDIKHVVLLMQENRSFDHYFGTLSGVRGFSDPKAMKLPSGDPVFKQPDSVSPDGYLLPFHLDSKSTSAQAIPSTSHAWDVQHKAWNNGTMDSWLPAHRAADGANGPYTMGYYTRDDIPFQFALAENFTVLDRYHCSVMGPTHPNRYMWMSGTVDPNGLAGGPCLDNGAPNGTYSWKTYPERLQEAGVSFKFYHQQPDGTGVDQIHHMKQYLALTPDQELYQRTVQPTPIGQFQYDAMNDQLPTVSWIFPPGGFDEHPANLPAAGATFVSGIVDAIAANPEVWAKTAFILSYDENDGMFDHVLPPTPKAGTADEFVTKTSVTGVAGDGLPVGLGFRVPCVIVSPWTVGGWVSSEVADHTSQLRFLEAVTGVKETNISQWRRRTVGDLTSAFRFNDKTSKAPALPDTNGQYSLAQYEVSQLPKPAAPTANQRMPHQEPGSRPHIS